MVQSIVFGLIGLALVIAPARAANSKAEVDFVTRAANGNLAAITESKLALDRSSDAQLKDFAHQLIEDHEKAETALEAAAEGSGAAAPSTVDADHQARATALEGKSGADFDKAYVAEQAEIHSNALTLYADYMLLGENAKLKALAIELIPITGGQFKRVQALSSR